MFSRLFFCSSHTQTCFTSGAVPDISFKRTKKKQPRPDIIRTEFLLKIQFKRKKTTNSYVSHVSTFTRLPISILVQI